MTMVLVLVSGKAGAQYDPYYSHYYDMQTTVNPAAAGKENRLNVQVAYSMAMAGFDNAPKTVYLTGDMPFMAFKSVHGVGLQLQTDNLGLFSHQRISALYSLRLKLGGGNFSVGVMPGMLTEKFRGSDVELEEENDPVFTKSDIDGNAFDLGVGLYYSRKNWYAGVSAQHLTAPTVTLGEKYEMNVSSSFYAMGGVDFQLRNPMFKIATSAIVRSDFVAYRADVTGRLLCTFDNKMLYGGVSYSPTNSVTALIGGKLNGFYAGYSFEIFTNGISARNGSHELMIGYQMDIDLGKKGKNFHQTTRTL